MENKPILVLVKPSTISSVVENESELRQLYCFLSQFIVAGYDRLRLKYNYLSSPRITNYHTFVSEIFGSEKHIKDKNTFLGLLVAPDGYDYSLTLTNQGINENTGLIDSPTASTLSATQKIPWSHKDVEVMDLEDLADPSIISSSSFQSKLLGSVAIKPMDDDPGSYELTGFVSFAAGVGSLLCELAHTQCVKRGISRLWSLVVREHQLVGYYEKLGYVQKWEKLIDCISSSEENSGRGLNSVKDFHIVGLIMELPISKAHL